MPKSSRRKRAKSARARKHKRERLPDSARLLYRRREVADMLGVSVATVIRLEATASCPGLKLGSTKNFRTLYRAADVHRLAGVKVA